ncbi:MAG: hypothetical protein JKY08_07335 [Flavobacteriaceae bacterium]|nr:hypothetical protein [Flavobacteriaceae bacterium]
MRYLYKLLAIILLVPSVLLATDQIGKHSKSKKIHKEFSINNDGIFTITNKYGNINITTWNENRIVIDVYIETNGNDEQKVIDKLKKITVDFDNGISFLRAKTVVQKSGYSRWNLFGNNQTVGIKINYTVKMPVTNTLIATNDYGNISINKLQGKATINCDYGNLFIGELLHLNNEITIHYNGKSTIESMKGGKINSYYSTLEIDKSDILHVNANYSHIQIGSSKNLKYSCDYGDLNADNIGVISGRSDYFHVKIKTLSNSAKLSSDYGSIKIETILAGFSSVKISSDYGNIKLGIEDNTPYNFKANVAYGNLKIKKEGYTFQKKITKNSDKFYQGYYLKENKTSYINVQTSYGNVTITNL